MRGSFTQSQSNNFWFELDKEEVPSSVTATINEIENRQSQRYLDNLLYLGLYSGKRINGLGVYHYDQYGETDRRISLNLTQACTDTITSKIGKNNPKVTFLTDNGDYFQQEKAKNLEKYISGQFARLGIYKLATKCLKSACIFGDGLVKVYERDSEIFVEKTLSNEIIVDSREAFDGNPRNLYQVKQVSKVVLKKIYPDKEEQIEECSQQSFLSSYNNYDPFYRNDMVPVIEGWHLPSKKDKSDGRHIICIPNASLLDETWENDYFPFPKLSFSEKVMGFWNAGIPEIGYTIQCEIDRVMNRISDSIWLNSVPRIFYEYSSKIVKEHFNNDVGSMIGYRGQMPQIFTPTSVGGDVFGHVDRLYQKFFEIIGISQMSVGSVKQTAMSGKAIRESQDTEGDRFAALKQQYDNFHLDIANQILDRSRDIAKYDKTYSIITQDQSGTVRIKWSEVSMKKDSYIMQMYPTNLLSSHPSGRLADTIDLMNVGLLTKDEALSLLDYPDIKSVISIEKAQREDILCTISTMINENKYLPPEVAQNLQLGIQYCQASYLIYKNKKVDQERLDLLLRWITEAGAIQAAMAPPVPQAAPIPEQGLAAPGGEIPEIPSSI